MAELATIARPYAEALFKASHGQLDVTADWLGELSVLAASPELQQFAESPKTEDAKVFEVMAKVVSKPLGALAENFLKTLVSNGRLQALPQIAKMFHELKYAHEGVSDAEIFSAFEMDASTLSQTKNVLEKRFGRKLDVTVKLQPDLIGGIRVVVGDEVLDTSVKARLEQMKVALIA